MNTHKKYLLPIVLILILALVAGVFIFNQRQSEDPTNTIEGSITL